MRMRALLGSNMEGVKLKTGKGVVGYYVSSANNIVFFSDVIGEGTDVGRLFPQVVVNPDDVLDWEMTEEAVNCESLTSLRYILNE